MPTALTHRVPFRRRLFNPEESLDCLGLPLFAFLDFRAQAIAGREEETIGATGLRAVREDRFLAPFARPFLPPFPRRRRSAADFLHLAVRSLQAAVDAEALAVTPRRERGVAEVARLLERRCQILVVKGPPSPDAIGLAD